jgi:hypothetical protein
VDAADSMGNCELTSELFSLHSQLVRSLDMLAKSIWSVKLVLHAKNLFFGSGKLFRQFFFALSFACKTRGFGFGRAVPGFVTVTTNNLALQAIDLLFFGQDDLFPFGGLGLSPLSKLSLERQLAVRVRRVLDPALQCFLDMLAASKGYTQDTTDRGDLEQLVALEFQGKAPKQGMLLTVTTNDG